MLDELPLEIQNMTIVADQVGPKVHGCIWAVRIWCGTAILC
jgi:hypothetical protein